MRSVLVRTLTACLFVVKIGVDIGQLYPLLVLPVWV